MANFNISALNRAKFVSMVAKRLRVIGKSSDAPVKALSTYHANELADALHPHVQFLTVKEIIEHSPDMKSFLLAPDFRGPVSEHCARGRRPDPLPSVFDRILSA